MIKSTMAELSTSAINNSPLGSESMNTVDDNVRVLGAIMKRGSSIKNATFASGVVTLGDEAGTYIVNATTTITSIVGGFTDGVFDILFSNETAVNIESSSTITTSTMLVSKGKSITVTKASTGVFTVVGSNIQLEPRVKVLEDKATAIEAKDVAQDETLTSHTNSINALNTAVDKRNQIVWGYTDGNGYYGDQYLSNMGNTWLHTAINLPVGVWEVTGYSAMVFNDSVSGSVPIGLVRADNTTTGVITPAVFQHFKGDGGQYMPTHVKAIIVNDTGSDQNYRLKTGNVTVAGNRQGHGLFGSSVGETKMWAIRCY